MMRKAISTLSSIGLLDSSLSLILPHRTFVRRRPNDLLCSDRSPRLSSRLFGAKVGSTTTPGDIYVEDTQTALKNIDLDGLRATVNKVRDLIGYSTYDVCLYLIDDKDMQELNNESRNVDAPTDILSYALNEPIKPGTIAEPQFDIPDCYNLGDMLVDVRYVMRSCEEDKAIANGEVELEEDGEEYEDDDRGVSGAMSSVFDPEKRIHMLLVHGMLHLVGYDHENDEDYELMVTKEEEILKKLDLLQ